MKSTPYVMVVTGGAGAGKSTAARHLGTLGASVIDTDVISREVIEEDAVRKGLVDAFGPHVLDTQGGIDRGKLAEAAFRGTQTVAMLNAVTHPRILEVIRERLDEAAREGADTVVMDVPLLEDVPELRDEADVVLVIEAPQASRVARLVSRGFTERDARRRISLQPGDAERRRGAGAIVVNDGDEAAFLDRLDEVWSHFVAVRRHDPPRDPAEEEQP